jgi:hypothetical protein
MLGEYVAGVPTQFVHDETAYTGDDITLGNVFHRNFTLPISSINPWIFPRACPKTEFMVCRISLFVTGWSMGTLSFNVIHFKNETQSAR